MPTKLIDTVACANELGENPLWHPLLNKLFWIDIEKAQLFEYDLVDKKCVCLDLPFRIGSFGFTQNPDQIIAAFAQGIAKYNLVSGDIEWLAEPEKHLGYTRFNDGRVDPQGRFWAGTMVETDKIANKSDKISKGGLYRLDHDGRCVKVLDNINISNGLCWKHASATMLHADSPKQTVTEYAYDASSGTLGNSKVFALTNDDGYPDGGIIDTNDHYWHARWAAGKVVCLDPAGKIITELSLPVTQVTSVAIGGPNMDLLFVTSARIGLDANTLEKQSQAGNLFIYQLEDALGVAEAICTV